MNLFFSFYKNFSKNQKIYNYFKVVSFATLFYTQKEYFQKSQNVYTHDSQTYDAKLKEQFQRKIPELDNFFSNVMILSGNANKDLANEISKILGIQLGDCTIGRFADGEVNISINESVRGKDIYVIQPTCSPVNENIMELLLIISALRRASSRRINVLMPYYGYSRQDRQTAPRVPISAADVARLYENVGVDRVICIDLHCGQIQGFFGPKVPVDNLEANLVGLNYFLQQQGLDLSNMVIVSPDAGGVTRAKRFQELFNIKARQNSSLAMIIKQRDQPGKIAQMNLVGSVEGKHAIIVDDMIDTAVILYFIGNIV
ncbi:phosphoribosylpyrophosphate synthetase, putative [Ichthyophthirius multifiliis]|uniref:ribose-phosphate diphosphokinase n=1 Tax=Ichthyophthirius multifiliis TaxID=5932 RepID=G0R3Q0_ICHMU|nr:phosphoribosylpyrophosphate synthetase, putative [Ichthyophthirius multifiliis]EGR27905.1 phosphoribosylpyrophosphate synthetase, putative [Ichthyophthirius multifiliis]|eukprot:XP_004027250.1 phosphoribosylpyrophosphate synthetase, putative [Ichthyophthirius multifiliis]